MLGQSTRRGAAVGESMRRGRGSLEQVPPRTVVPLPQGDSAAVSFPICALEGMGHFADAPLVSGLGAHVCRHGAEEWFRMKSKISATAGGSRGIRFMRTPDV